MSDQQPGMSDAFRAFMHEASGHAKSWMGTVRSLDEASALDKKTEGLPHLAVVVALRLESGVPLRAQLAKEAGASRKEVISAVLVGLPVAEQGVTQVLPMAIGHTMPDSGRSGRRIFGSVARCSVQKALHQRHSRVEPDSGCKAPGAKARAAMCNLQVFAESF